VTDAVVNLPVLHEKQLLVAKSQARFVVACCGRRFGKSELAIGMGLYWALVNGEAVWWAVPVYKNALDAWQRLQFFARQVPGVIVSKDEAKVSFPSGGYLQVQTMNNYDNVRGSGLDHIIFDEAAFAAEQAWTNVLMPMLATTKVKVMQGLLISTPNGFNWFWKMFQDGKRPGSGVESFHFTSHDNPYINREFLDYAKRTMPPQVYAQEIMAEFVDSAGAVFSGIKHILQDEAPSYDPMNAYVMGVDWGRKHDFTAISIWDANRRCEMRLERFNQIGFEFQAQRIKALAEEYGVSIIVAEENGIGLPNVERLQEMGLPVEPFKMTTSSKKPVIESLALAIDNQTITLLDIEDATNELYSYVATVTPTGMIRYSAPEGGFDDTVIARALAYHAIGQGVGDILDLDELLA
jgi:hypothetical protein